jgi:hypothetical protein
MCFACILFFIYLCLQYSKKKKNPEKKKEKLALTSKEKKKKLWDLLFDSILMSRDRAKPSSH